MKITVKMENLEQVSFTVKSITFDRRGGIVIDGENSGWVSSIFDYIVNNGDDTFVGRELVIEDDTNTIKGD